MTNAVAVQADTRREWSALEVLHWAEQFRQMMLTTHAEPGMSVQQVYDKIRAADPSRRIAHLTETT